jgi:nitroimidazol reductase NimA-like FMN-containing flavoprotein (pyridoxamine 5'-phosphate oxidase superfamily)
MRRKDREIREKIDVIEIIDKCEVCRIGLAKDNVPYVVPMNYGYEYVDEKLKLYFHGAKEGKKLDIIGENPFACFQIDCSNKLVIGKEAWNYTMEYESVMGSGIISICTDMNEKIHGMNLLMKQYVKDKEFDFPGEIVESIVILKMEVMEFTGKRHMR